jgi:hypothetical protein
MENDEEVRQEVQVRSAKVLVWGPIYITLNLERTPNNQPAQQNEVKPEEKPIVTTSVPDKEQEQNADSEGKTKTKTAVNILSPAPSNPINVPVPAQKEDNTKKVTYIYNLIDHGLDCECVDVKGELLIRSALPVYRKITQGIEFEQITSNQLKLIITSRVLENYQEVFQGFALPKATFRVWIMGYKF